MPRNGPACAVMMSCEQRGRSLFESVGDAAARQIVGRHFDADSITHQNPDVMLAHFSGNGCEDNVRAVVELYLEKCVGLFVDDCAFSRH